MHVPTELRLNKNYVIFYHLCFWIIITGKLFYMCNIKYYLKIQESFHFLFWSFWIRRFTLEWRDWNKSLLKGLCFCPWHTSFLLVYFLNCVEAHNCFSFFFRPPTGDQSLNKSLTVEKGKKQAGAELCQAQVKLGFAMLDLLSKKLGSSSLWLKI